MTDSIAGDVYMTDSKLPTRTTMNGTKATPNGATSMQPAPIPPVNATAKFSIALPTSSSQTKPFTLSSTSTTVVAANVTKKRTFASTLDEDSEHTSSAVLSASAEISTFGVDSAAEERERRKKEEEGRVIQRLPNRDWREESRRKRQKSGLPGRDGGGSNDGSGGGGNAETFAAPVAYGLTVVRRSVAGKGEEGNAVTLAEEGGAAATAEHDIVATSAQAQTQAPPEQTLEEAALSALLNNHPTAPTIATIVPAAQTEDAAFRSSFAAAPPMSTLDEYAATPVEGYGAAILRGYLKPGETLEARQLAQTDMKKKKMDGKDGKKAGDDGAPVRRPGLLGLGAKEGPGKGEGVELGVWNKGRAAGRGREEVVYNPVARRNRKTGEVVSEEELKRRVEAQKIMAVVGEREGDGDGSRSGREGRGREHRGEGSRKMIEYTSTSYSDEREQREAPSRREKERRSRYDEDYDRDDRRDRHKQDSTYNDRDRDRELDKHRERDRERERDYDGSHTRDSDRRSDRRRRNGDGDGDGGREGRRDRKSEGDRDGRKHREREADHRYEKERRRHRWGE